MSRKVVRVGVFLLVASLALIAKGIYGDEPNPKPAAGGDDPFSPEPPKSAAAGPLAVPEKYGRLLRTITVEDDRQTYGDFNDNGYWSGTEWKGHKNLPAGYWVYMAPQWYIFAEAATASAGPTKSVAKKPAISDDGGFGDETPPSAKPAKAAKPVPAADANAKPKSPAKLHGGEKAILAALKRKASFDFTEMPLEDVIAHISNKYRIPIVRDQSGLKDAGVDPETPVTCHLSGISLQSALELMLDELQLKWVIHHDVLMITSPQRAESDEFMLTKRYDVADLLNQPSDFASEDNPLTAPGAGQQNNNTGMIPGWGMGGGGAKGGNSGMGDYPRIPPPNSLRDRPLEIREIMDLIQNIVATKSWLDNGGNGTISTLGGHMLVISQTEEVHRELDQLFAKLRKQHAPTVNVELHWLWLDAKHRNEFLAHGVTARSLEQVAAEVPRFHANVACTSGLGTVISSGDRRWQIISAIPVIGSGVGYQPVTSMPNVGIRSEIRPTLTAGGKTASLFVQSTITRWTPSRRPAIVGSAWPADQETSVEQPPAKTTPPSPPVVHIEKTESGSGSCPIDLPVMPTQEFGTTLRVPLGKPVVIGSVTFAPAGDAGVGEAKQDAMEVYLIATTSIVKRAVKSAVKKAK